MIELLILFFKPLPFDLIFLILENLEYIWKSQEIQE